MITVLYFQVTIENLNLQLEQFESRIEQLTTKKKKMDKDVRDLNRMISCVIYFIYYDYQKIILTIL